MKNNTIQTLINEKKYFEIRKYLNDLNTVEVSELLNQFESSELIMIFRLLLKIEQQMFFHIWIQSIKK